MAFLSLSPLVLGALAVGFLVVTPFCVLMWRAGYNVGWASLPFAALLLLNFPVSTRPTELIVAAAVYLVALYAFVLTTGKGERQQRSAARRAKSKTWQPLESFAAPSGRPAVASRMVAARVVAPAGTMLVMPNGTLRPAPWASQARTSQARTS